MKRTAVQQQWIDALKSGEYTQGQGSLCERGAYCCLGVAAEITPDIPFMGGDRGYIPETITLDGEVEDFRVYGVIPSKYNSVLGFDNNRLSYHLMEMNDTRKRSFTFIARFLEIIWPVGKEIQ